MLALNGTMVQSNVVIGVMKVDEKLASRHGLNKRPDWYTTCINIKYMQATIVFCNMHLTLGIIPQEEWLRLILILRPPPEDSTNAEHTKLSTTIERSTETHTIFT